jgi:hypothetical protein
MSSYTKWDRAAYIERVGGEEEAERRRKVLMAARAATGWLKSASAAA